jgi:hypothetical protein
LFSTARDLDKPADVILHRRRSCTSASRQAPLQCA